MKKLLAKLTLFISLIFLPNMGIAALKTPILSYSTSGLNVSASWTAVPDASGYTLYYAPFPYTGLETIGSLDVGSSLGYAIDLWGGASYYIAVEAYNSLERSGYSNIELFTVTTAFACTDNYGPVCGTDDKTYRNSCVAEQNATTVAYQGECLETEEWQKIPLSSSISKVQPMTGIVFWADSHEGTQVKEGDAHIQLEFAYVRPSDIVQEQGQYDWSSLEDLLEDIASRGHQAILRWYYVYPGEATGVPDYIKHDVPDYQETIGLSEGLQTYFPDWTSLALQDFNLDFYSKFAQKYDDDPRIAFLQVGFGLWAEYHIYDGPNEIGEQFPSHTFQTTFFNHLASVFSSLHYSISIDAGDSYYSPISGSAQLLTLGFGLFDDSFMQEEHDDYNREMWQALDYQQRYTTSPFGGELSYYSDYDQQHALDEEGMYGRTFEELSARYHISYMIGNDQPNLQTKERIKEAGMAIGYKFTITDLQSSTYQSKVTVANTGIAPIYYDAYVSVNGVRAETSLRSLLPNQSYEYTVDSGGENPVIAIECDRLVAGQQIQYEVNLSGQ